MIKYLKCISFVFKEVIFFMVRIYIVTTSPVDFVTTCPIPHYVHFDTRDAVTKTN